MFYLKSFMDPIIFSSSKLILLNYIILQRYILSLDGPVVTASGFGDELVVVTHSSPSLPSNEQVLILFCCNPLGMFLVSFHPMEINQGHQFDLLFNEIKSNVHEVTLTIFWSFFMYIISFRTSFMHMPSLKTQQQLELNAPIRSKKRATLLFEHSFRKVKINGHK